MSEQEKKMNGVIEAEGTVKDAEPKESKIRKLIDSHPKTVKWAKRIGVGACWIGTTALAYLVGANAKRSELSMPALNEADTDDEDEIEEEPAE